MKSYIVNVNGDQVYSAEYVFEQMQAQCRRIDRIKRIAISSMAVSVVSVICCGVLWCLVR